MCRVTQFARLQGAFQLHPSDWYLQDIIVVTNSPQPVVMVHQENDVRDNLYPLSSKVEDMGLDGDHSGADESLY